MISYMKANKIAGPAQLSKKLIPFIEQMFIIVNSETKEVIIEDNKLKDIEKDYNRKLTDLSLREKSFELKEKELIIRENKLESELLKNNKVKVEHRKVDDSDIVEFLTYIRDDYYRSGFTKNLEFFKKYGYTYDNNGIYKNK